MGFVDKRSMLRGRSHREYPFESFLTPGTTGVPLPVTHTWAAASGAAQYEVYLCADPASLALITTVYKPQATLTGLSFRKTYYWRVIAKNPCGSTSGPLWTFISQFPVPRPVPRLATEAGEIPE